VVEIRRPCREDRELLVAEGADIEANQAPCDGGHENAERNQAPKKGVVRKLGVGEGAAVNSAICLRQWNRKMGSVALFFRGY